MSKLEGGFVIHKVPCIQSSNHAHTGVLERPLSDADLAALNNVQATPWRINGYLLDVMSEAWSRGLRLGGLEVGEPAAIETAVPRSIMARLTAEERRTVQTTGRLPDPVWEALETDDRRDYVGRRAALHAHNASVEGRSRAVLDALGVAQELRPRPAIWFPHGKDFRGRLYSRATFGPYPQGSDIQKALLHFADGVPLGDDGMYWLCIRAANTFGQDKLTFSGRVAWVLENRDAIRAAAADPLGTSWWTTAAEPWSFLATAHELASVWCCGNSKAFASHLPIPLDGSCNGLQHLAAMGLDTEGAHAVNLTADPERQDIYQTIADRVSLQVQQDVLDGLDEARVWHGRVDRKVVKRAVMTTPYGVTDRGIRDQLIADGHVPSDEDTGRGKSADYLKDRIVTAIGGTVQSARSIMAWLQTTADRLARAGMPFDWSTPTGGRVRQAYHTSSRVQLRTLAGSVVLLEEHRDGGLNTRKQALGAPPNFIHSFDAAHLTMTVNACSARGLWSFAMIHDSYGTHAAHTTTMASILRDQFVRIYRDDWLAKTAADVAEYAPFVKIDAPPARGLFDIEQVRHAPFFFS